MGEDAAAEIVKNLEITSGNWFVLRWLTALLDSQQQGEVLQEFTEMAVEARAGLASVDFTRSAIYKSVACSRRQKLSVESARLEPVWPVCSRSLTDATSIMNLLK